MTKEENSERYGDCCEVNYPLIEKDKQKAIKKYKKRVLNAIDKCTMKDGVYGDSADTLYLEQLKEELGLE